jgi:hypothetical protein
MKATRQRGLWDYRRTRGVPSEQLWLQETHSDPLGLREDLTTGMAEHEDTLSVRNSSFAVSRFFAVPYVLILVGLGAAYLYGFIFIQPAVMTDTVLLDYWVTTIFRYASSPVDLSVMSPVQGLGNLVLPLAVWLDPVQSLAHICHDFVDPAVFSRFVAIVLLSGAVLALARLAGLGWLPSVLAAQTVAVAYFPPNFKGFIGQDCGEGPKGGLQLEPQS